MKGMSYNRKMIGYSRIKGKLWRIKSHGRLRKGATKRKKCEDTLKGDCGSMFPELGVWGAGQEETPPWSIGV